MNSVGTDVEDVNIVSIDTVTKWIEAMSKRGLYQENTARFRATALRELSGVLGDDEPHTAKYLLDNVDQLAQRWMTKKSGSPSTRDAYKGKGRVALEDYFAYRDGNFKGRTRPEAQAARKRPEPTTKAVIAAAPAPHAEPPRPASPPSPEMRTFPLGDGRELRFVLPHDWTMGDAVKTFYHLATIASDFDPTKPAIAKMFAMVKLD